MEQFLSHVTTLLKVDFAARPPLVPSAIVLAAQQLSALQRSFTTCFVWTLEFGLFGWREIAWEAEGSAKATDDRGATAKSATARLRNLVFMILFEFTFVGTFGFLRFHRVKHRFAAKPLTFIAQLD